MQITYSIDINAPRSVVWDYVDDSEKMKLWMKGVVKVEEIERTPDGVGSRSVMSIKEGRKTSDYQIEVMEYDVNERLKVRMSGGCFKEGMTMFADYRFSDIDGGATRLDYVCTGEGITGMWKLLGPVFAIFGKMQLKGFLKKLKELAEGEARGVPA